MISRNERERLRMSESLMNLLLMLVGIQGTDLGIRVCRKGVTRKAIALQIILMPYVPVKTVMTRFKLKIKS